MRLQTNLKGMCEIAFARPLDQARFTQLKGYLTSNYTLIDVTEEQTMFKIRLNKKHFMYIEKRKAVMFNLCKTESAVVDFMEHLKTELSDTIRQELFLILNYMKLQNRDYYIRIE